MNNYWHTNYRAEQGGHFRFRYVITSATRTDGAALSRMGWEESTPLEHDQISSQDKALDLPRPLNGNEASFLTIDDPISSSIPGSQPKTATGPFCDLLI